jgi:hypothetical protein
MTAKKMNKLLVEHLRTISHEELVTLVLEFAPDHYRQSIKFKQASPRERQDNLASVREEIKNLAWDSYPTHEQIDQMVITAITKLRPFWKLYPSEVLEVYRDLAVTMHTAQEDGILYDRMQDVYMETGWPSEVLDFLDGLDDEQHEVALHELSKIRESLEWISAAYVVDGE